MPAETRSKKVSTLIFLFAIFILLAVFTGAWIYRMYKEQTEYSEERTLATVECGKYYFSIDPRTVLYEEGTLYFEIENTLGAELKTIVVQGVSETKEVEINLPQGTTMPVSVPLEVVGWVMVYPKGCQGVNFKNLSFEPRVYAEGAGV